MKVKKVFIFFLLCIYSIEIFAGGEIYTGEENIKLYYGPIDNSFIKKKDKILMLDDLYYKSFIEDSIGSDIFVLTDFYNDELIKSGQCPEHFFQENSSYIRYLFRLLTMSYLYESVKKYHYTLYSLGGSIKSCPRNFKKILKSCRPMGKDMSLFVKRAKSFFERDHKRQKYKKMEGKSVARWLETFPYRRKALVSSSRIYSWCLENGKSCEKIKLEDAIKGLEISCNEDVQLAKLICSESDELYGLSYANKAIKLLAKSHSLKVVNRGGHGEACLERFSSTFKKKEIYYYQLSELFRITSETLERIKNAYAQGGLFLPGALKEFDDLGLNNFLYIKKEIVKKVVAKKVVKKGVRVKVIPVPPPTPRNVAKKLPKLAKIIKKTIKVPLKKISYFEKSFSKFEKKSLKIYPLNIKKYKSDYVFSKNFVTKMKSSLEIYQARVAIEDMKKYDQIGSLKTPFQVSFIKYLIDFNHHQGLFNIVSILGNKFYIKNDLERKNKAIYISLLNDETTDYQWQISFIRPGP